MTSGTLCACEAVAASWVTVSAVVASSKRRRFVMMMRSRKKSWAGEEWIKARAERPVGSING
jgi:hypothetical protein